MPKRDRPIALLPSAAASAGQLQGHFSLRRRLLAAAALSQIALTACSSGSSPAPLLPGPPEPTRNWKLGFSGTPPRPDVAVAVRGIDTWSTRAEIAAIHEELPWTELLGGVSADVILDRDKVGLVQYYRGKGLQLFFMADPTDGLAREKEAPQLRALGRSLAEAPVQQAYRDYVAAVVRKLRPDYIGLAPETNLIRLAAPAAVYGAVVQAANAAAADLRATGNVAPVFISVQVETAWGLLGGRGPFVGIDADLRDFPFTQLLGLSSYPYFSFAQPEDIPGDYYSRLFGESSLGAMVVEGGWSSANVGTVNSSPELQARYISRHPQLLDSVKARGLIQLVFADLDLAAFPPPLPASLPLFASIGLTDSQFAAKPALAAWDALHSRRLVG